MTDAAVTFRKTYLIDMKRGRKMKVLSIGNSFSADATRYLSKAALSLGVDVSTFNLYIGGCSLRTHYINAIDDKANYTLEHNGESTGFCVSIKQALAANEYDVVTLQQASHFSFKPETFEPYTAFLFDLIKKYNPHAKIYVHQTWGYKEHSARLAAMGFEKHADMYSAVENAYDIMFNNNDFSGLLPSGKAISLLHEAGFEGDATHRDDIHLSLGLARYTAALTWLEYLTGVSVFDCGFDRFDKFVSAQEVQAAKKCAHDACLWAQKYNKS